MPNQRDPSKKLVGFFASPEEKKLLQEAAKLAGFENLTEYLKWVARNQPVPKKKGKKES